MKKRILSILFAFMLICTLFAGCKNNENIKSFTVKIYTPRYVCHDSLLNYLKEVEGDFYVTTIEIKKGEVIGTIELNDIQEDKYLFCGWFSDEYFIDPWSLPKDEVHCDLTLYSKWEKID